MSANPTNQEWHQWRQVPLDQRYQMLALPGIYVVVDYVGKSLDLRSRWQGKSHHRYRQLHRANNRMSYQIYWQSYGAAELDEREQYFIEQLKSHLNYSRVRSYMRRALQANEELGRLLRVLNKPCSFYPVVRSVVLGNYTELVDGEGDALAESLSIVIGISVNDEGTIVLNSYRKSVLRRGQPLKGSWSILEHACGEEVQGSRLAYIPVFQLEQVNYEFAVCTNVLEQLEQHPELTCQIELAGHNVMALRDTNMLGALTILGNFYTFRSEDYLKYRLPELQPVTGLLPDVSGREGLLA